MLQLYLQNRTNLKTCNRKHLEDSTEASGVLSISQLDFGSSLREITFETKAA